MQSAQSPIFEPSHLPSLPKPSPIDHWIFESPYLPALVLLAVGIFVFFLLRHSKHAKKIGLPTLAITSILAGVVFALGTLVKTDSENLKSRSQELVQATANADQAALSNLLDEHAAVKTAFGSASSKDKIIALVRAKGTTNIESASTREIRVGIYGQQVARTQIKVRVAGDMLPSNSWWQIDWTRPDTTSDQWVATDIEPLWIQGVSNPTGTH